MADESLYSSSDAAKVGEICTRFKLTEAEFAGLQQGATAAKSIAYCPYSKFRVGAMLLNPDGSLTPGANIENASYPVGTCAERVAIARAITEGHQRDFRAIAVATDISPPASPCGMCRQFIREFCGSDMPVIMFDKDGKFAVLTVEQLLPMSFGPDRLPPPGAPGTS